MHPMDQRKTVMRQGRINTRSNNPGTSKLCSWGSENRSSVNRERIFFVFGEASSRLALSTPSITLHCVCMRDNRAVYDQMLHYVKVNI